MKMQQPRPKTFKRPAPCQAKAARIKQQRDETSRGSPGSLDRDIRNIFLKYISAQKRSEASMTASAGADPKQTWHTPEEEVIA